LELATLGLGNQCSIQLSYGALSAEPRRLNTRTWRRGPPCSAVVESRQSVLAEKFQGQPDALVRLLDLQQMPGAFDEAVVVAALDAERLVGRPGRRRAF